MAKKKKAVKKANHRGSWSTKPVVPLTFLNSETFTRRGGDEIKIAKTGVYFGPTHAEKMDIKKGDYLLLAKDGEDNIYIGKKPAGLFGGHRVAAHEKSPKRKFIQIGATKMKELNLQQGTYTIKNTTRTSMLDHNDKEVRFEVYKLVSV